MSKGVFLSRSIFMIALCVSSLSGCGSDSPQALDPNDNFNNNSGPNDLGSFTFTNNPIGENTSLPFTSLYEQDGTVAIGAFNVTPTAEELRFGTSYVDLTKTPICFERNQRYGVLETAAEDSRQLTEWYNDTVGTTAGLVIRIHRSAEKLANANFSICSSLKDKNYGKGTCAFVDYKKVKAEIIGSRVLHTVTTYCYPVSGSLKFGAMNNVSGPTGVIDIKCEMRVRDDNFQEDFQIKTIDKPLKAGSAPKNFRAKFRGPLGGALFCSGSQLAY